MSGESWAEYVDKAMEGEVQKSQEVDWASMERLRKGFIETGMQLAATGAPVSIGVDLAKSTILEYFRSMGQECAALTLLLVESWVREGYEKAGKG